MTLLRQGSGGQVRLTFDPFDPGALLTAFCHGRSESGAVATFTGLARADAGATTALELEAYPGFTEAEIGKFADLARARFGLDDFDIVHRVGRISPGEPVVFVATAARHRRAAFEACDFLMDYLKSKAPFWKKEHGPDGARWVEPRAEDHADLKRWDEETKP
jgi:molybdopterin synthase catalytic subunit